MDFLIEATAVLFLLTFAYGVGLWLIVALGFVITNIISGFRLIP